MSLLGAFLAFIAGWAVIRLISPRHQAGNTQDLCLAWGIGAGLASQFTFYVLLPFGRLIPWAAISLGLFSVGILCIVAIRRNRSSFFPSTHDNDIPLLGLFIFISILFIYQASQQPFGGYDAWSLWNYRAATVLGAGPQWSNVFHNEVQGQHPWLLPFFVVWGWLFTGQESPLVPMFIAAFTSVATIGLLACSLINSIGPAKAILAGLFLFFIPFFAWHGTSQYACIFVAFYALASVVCLINASRNDEKKDWSLSGLFLGLLMFTKDEGIVLGLTILLCSIVFLGKPRKIFWITLAAASLATILVKVLMRTGLMTSVAPVRSNMYDVDPGLIFLSERWKTIASFTWDKIILHAEFGRLRLWLPLLLLGLFSKEGRFVLFSLLLFFATFFFLYLMVANDLVWRLDVTLDRLLFQAMPTMIFLLFHSLFAAPTAKRNTPPGP